MMSPDNLALQELLFGNDLGDEAEGVELNQGPGVSEEGAAADTVSLLSDVMTDRNTITLMFPLRWCLCGGFSQTPAAASGHPSMTCAGCGEQVCDRFFLLAVGQAWHGACLRCSQCHCELQTHPSLYWRDGKIYCQQDYGRSEETFHPVCPFTVLWF